MYSITLNYVCINTVRLNLKRFTVFLNFRDVSKAKEISILNPKKSSKFIVCIGYYGIFSD